MEYFRNSKGSVGKCLSDSRIDERNDRDVVLVGGPHMNQVLRDRSASQSWWSCFRYTRKPFCQ